jgi:hypothetical protein
MCAYVHTRMNCRGTRAPSPRTPSACFPLEGYAAVVRHASGLWRPIAVGGSLAG